MDMIDTSGHLSVEDRKALGERARENAPVTSHAGWGPAADRPDPVELLVAQNATREADLVPVRHGRMMVSPFTFYRGSAAIMASDLAETPTAGLQVQLCGDAHLSNFGGFATPERQLVFGLNDFDETLPGPFEYDLKRLVASFTIAARHNKYSRADTDAATVETVRAYRSAMAEFAAMPTMDIWYKHMSEKDIREAMQAVRDAAKGGSKRSKDKVAKKVDQRLGKDKVAKEIDRQLVKDKAGKKRDPLMKEAKGDAADLDRALDAADKTMRKAHTRDSLHALPRFAELVDGRHRIVSQPPVVVPLRELGGTWGLSTDQIRQAVDEQFDAYKASLTPDRRQLLERFTIVDMARKVVGVGSVGTRAFMALLEGRDTGDPLFLQVKEATSSVLESHLKKSPYTPGRRVVEGQRLMQASSDIFLGWTTGIQQGRYYYWRQLRDMKASAVVEGMLPVAMTFYARICGWTLARAHARSGDPIAIAEYLSDGEAVDRALVDFGQRYADQNERDYQNFVNAAASGRIEAVQGV